MINFLRKIINKNTYYSILAFHFMAISFSVLLFYKLIPILLNYPPNSINNPFQMKVNVTYYAVYYFVITMLGFFIEMLYLRHVFKPLKKWQKNKSKHSIEEIAKLRKIALETPLKTFFAFIFIPFVIIIFLLIGLSTDIKLTFKIASIIIVFLTLPTILSYITMKRLLKPILIDTYSEEIEKYTNIKQYSTFKLILLQTVPIIVVALLFMLLITMAIYTKEIGNKMFESNKTRLDFALINVSEFNSIEDVKLKLKEYAYDSEIFCINKNTGEVYTSDGKKLSNFFIQYTNEFFEKNGGRTYDDFGSDVQGAVKLVTLDGEVWIIGYKYSVVSPNVVIITFIYMLVLLIVTLSVLIYFARNISEEIKNIVIKLNEISVIKDTIGSKMKIVSNDEFANLVRAYNKIQDMNNEFIEELEEQQNIIVKQGQLVSIGELAGGVAHDINTPIAAIKTGIVMLSSMTSERTDQEKEIIFRMDNCANKIITIVNSMRNQIRNLGGDTDVDFKISSVLKDIKIITYNEISKNRSDVVIDIKDDVSIKGDPTKLGQVFTNLVVNAAQAYGEETGGKIIISVEEDLDGKNALVKVIDFAGGIDVKILPFVFKNILTTKGIKGTGLGLYLVYSVIVGSFKGDISFDSSPGNGTTFFIKIPKSSEKDENQITVESKTGVEVDDVGEVINKAENKEQKINNENNEPEN